MTGAAGAERQTEAASQKYGTVVFPSKERRSRQSGGTCRPIALKLEAQVSFERTSMDGPESCGGFVEYGGTAESI